MKKILIAIAILALLVVGYFKFQPTNDQIPADKNSNQAVTPIPLINALDTEPVKVPNNWTTYKSKYGYEVSFPNEGEWKMVDQTIGQTYAYNDEYLMAPNTGCLMDEGDCPEILLQISALNDQTPPIINSSLNGIPAGRFDISSDNYSYRVQNGSNIFQINYNYLSTMKFSKEIAETVLDSFKFTDPNKPVGTVMLESESYIEPVVYPLKTVNWCDENIGKTNITGLWVSSENFSGINHGPSIQHVCRGTVELFRMEMVNESDTLKDKTGLFVMANKKIAFKFLVSAVDPEFKLLDVMNARNYGQVWMSVDGKTIFFNEQKNIFVGVVGK